MNASLCFSKKFFLFAGLCAASAGTLVAVSPSDVYDDPLISRQWQWDPEQGGINIADAWKSGITGSGVVIGICDQWVEPFHEDLNVSTYNVATDWQDADLSLGLSYDFRNPGFSPAEGDEQPYTDHGHGTACAGMAAAVGGNGVGTVGAAPGATIAGLHIAVEGGGLVFTNGVKLWASGLDANGNYLGEAEIGVKSCSFGSSFGNASGTDTTLARTAANNVIYCFAASNDRGATRIYQGPTHTGWSSFGNIAALINVASTASTSRYSSFSSYGSNVFIAAPGSQVYSTDRTGDLGYNSSGDSDYTYWSGTSAATPLVSGVMALGKQICPDMDVRWAKHALAWASGHNETPNIDPDGTFRYTGESSTGFWQQNNGGYWFNNNYGFGIVDASGFVDATRDILYTTTETVFTQTSDGIDKTTSVETAGTARSAEFSVKTGTNALSQNIETVSVNVLFSDAAGALDLSTLKVTLVAPDDKSSIIVQGSAGDVSMTAGDLWLSNYTFLSNAFWGSTYGAENWTVRVEYTADAGVDTTDWVTVDSVKFTMGEVVFEAENASVAAGETVNAHAIALDKEDSAFSLAGTMLLEDSVLINAGTFEIAESGFVAAYEEGTFGADKGVKYTQNGGEATIRGSATFKRGATLNDGNLNLYNTISTGTGMSVRGGTLTIGASNAAVSVGTTLSVYGGKVVLAESAVFSSALNAEGGAIELRDGATAEKKISVGKSGGIGGSLSASGTVYAKSGIEFAGTASGTFAAGTAIKNGGLTLSGGSVVWSGLLSVDGGIKVADGALGSTAGNIASYAGTVTNAGTLGVLGNATVTFTEDAVFTNGANAINLGEGSVLRLESGIVGNALAGSLIGSGKLELTQDTIFNADTDAFAGTLAIENGILSVSAGAELNLGTGAVLELGVTDAANWLSVEVAAGGNIRFAEGAGLIVNFTGILADTSEFTVMSWTDDDSVSGLADLERGSGIELYVGGVEYENDNWFFVIDNNALKLNLDVMVIDIKEREQIADLKTDDYIANFSTKLEEYVGTISGTGSVTSMGKLTFGGDFSGFDGTVYVNAGVFSITESAKLNDENYVVSNAGTLSLEGTRDFGNTLAGAGQLVTAGTITLSADASAFTGKTSVASGSLTISKNAKLGTGAFDVAGTLILVGDRTFSNATSGTGTLNVASGAITFTTDVGTAILDISENASAKFTGENSGFSGALTGAGTLTTTADFTFGGDASGFSGATRIESGTFTVLREATLGSGAFELSGTLALNGIRTFTNAISGSGTIEVASGETTFTKKFPIANLKLIGNATAKISGENTGFSGTLAGTGTLATTVDFAFGGDASGFNGTVRVEAGTFTVSETAQLGNAAFDVAGILALNGDRALNNAVRGAGTLEIVSGTTSFAGNVGIANLTISANAGAKFTGKDSVFSGTLSGAGTLTTTADCSFGGNASGFGGKITVEAGTLTLSGSAKTGTGDFDVAAAGTLNLGIKGEFSNKLSGDGTLTVVGDVDFSADASAFSGKTYVEEGAELSFVKNAKLGSGDFAILGELKIEGTRDVANSTSGTGTITLVTGSNVAFSNAIGAKRLVVEDGATLRGNVSMNYGGSSRLVLAGNLLLDIDAGEKVSLGGARALLEKTATLELQSDVFSRNILGVEELKSGETVSIFENGIVEGDVATFLATDDLLADFATTSIVIYDLSRGLSVRVTEGVEESAHIDMGELSESYRSWAMKDVRETLENLQAGFWNVDDAVFSGGNDPLTEAVLAGDGTRAREILDRLSPKSYAAMVAMAAEAFHTDARSISARLEQRRYDGFSKNARWEFFAQGQGNSTENDTGADSPSFDFDSSGVLAGADYKTSADTLVGLAFGADSGEAKIHNNGGKIESSSLRFTSYIGKTFAERFYVNAGATLGHTDYDIKRKTDYGKVKGDTDALSGGVFLETGAVLTLSDAAGIYAMPYAGVSYTHVQVDEFEESGNDKAFDSDVIKGDSLRTRVGCTLSWGFDVAETTWRLGIDFAYSHDFLGDEVDIDVISQSGDEISETAKALPESMFSVGPTLNVDLNSSTSLYGGYTFSSGTDSYVNHSANVGFRVRF